MAIEIGERAPGFELPGVDGDHHRLEDGAPATVVYWTCNHCPYALAWHDRMLDAARDYADRGVRFLAISSNDAARYPADSFEAMVERVESEGGWTHPYLHDESQEVARAFQAVCTPDFFGFNAADELQYRGRLDESKATPVPNARRELYEAMTAVARTGQGPREQIPSMGCSIKWRE
jgi:peroxiredoxin